MIAALVFMAMQGFAPRIETIAMRSGLEARDALGADVDLDGRNDVVIARAEPKKPFARTLAVHLARPTGFTEEPDLELALTSDVSAFAVGDVHLDPGAELLLFSAAGAFAWRPRAPEESRFARLCTAEFLWQLGDPELTIAWSEAVRDLDGDGLVDLLLPEPRGWLIALQTRGPEGTEFSRTSALRAPRDVFEGGAFSGMARGERSFQGRRGRGQMRVSFGMNSPLAAELERSGPLVDVVESTPAPQMLDWDADGDLDLLAQTRKRLCVFLQERGAFPSAPSHAYDLPVPMDRSRRLDASYSSHAVDLDGDGRADCAILAGDQRSDDVRTQAQFFVQGKGKGDSAQTSGKPLFGDRGLPQQLLVILGFVVSATFERVDADPLPDLVLRTIRPDLIDQLRSISSESVDTDVYVYLNRGGTLSRRPDLSWRYPIKLRTFDPNARFIGDWNGDGLAEFFVRAEPERVRIHSLRRESEGLAVIGQPLWEYAVDAKSIAVFLDVAERTFLIVGPGTVTRVSAR